MSVDSPAFPCGLTKREYFAAAALTGIMANPRYSEMIKTLAVKREMDEEYIFAKLSCGVANALIKQLEGS